MARALLLLLTTSCAVMSSAPRSPAEWDEGSLCDHRPTSIVIVDDRGQSVRNATVWTEARMREGGNGMGETIAWDVVRTGAMARTDEQGRVAFCDVTTPLLAEYGSGWISDGPYGRSWRSLVAVDLFVQSGMHYSRVRRFGSRAWGMGQEYPLEPRLVVKLDQTTNGVTRPVVGRPSDEPLFELAPRPAPTPAKAPAKQDKRPTR